MWSCENLKCLKPVLIFKYTEIRAGEPQGPESSASKFETGFEKTKRYKSLFFLVKLIQGRGNILDYDSHKLIDSFRNKNYCLKNRRDALFYP